MIEKINKYQILHFADYSPDFSGSFIETLQNLTLSLRNERIESVLVFPFYRAWHSMLKEMDINVELFPSPHLTKPFSFIKLLFRFKKTIGKYDIRIVHCHFSRDYLLFIILYKYVFNRKIIIIWHWHNLPATLVGENKNYFKRILRDHFYKIISQLINQNIAISSEIYSWLFSFCQNVTYIPNGISLRKFDIRLFEKASDIRTEFGIPKDCSVICSVANFRPQKDYHTLLMAAKEVITQNRNSYFVLVGDGPTKKSIEKLSLELGINEHIIFTGLREDVQRIIYFSNIFVLSTHYEGLPYVLCEAMALSKPIIATNVSGCRDLVNLESGILVNHEDYKNFAISILELLNNPEIANNMGKKGRKIVETQFTLEKQTERIINVYKEFV